MPAGSGADAFSTVVEMFGIYAVLLAGWGLWHHRRAVASGPESSESPPAEPVAVKHERGAAARRHLNAGP
jgi:hypothetical protein